VHYFKLFLNLTIPITGSTHKEVSMELAPLNYIPFQLCRMKSAKVLWVSNELNLSDDDVFEKFAFGIPTNDCFKSVEFDKDQMVIGLAERYGGSGCGGNGGGVRCANIGNVQIKGIGTNLLVGTTATEWYSHGSLHIVDAICEVIYSHLFNNTLPLGTLKSYGIILTANDAGYYNNESIDKDKLTFCWGCLLIRPAHFMGSRQYQPKQEFKHLLYKDAARTRAANKFLYANNNNNPETLYNFFADFSKNCANQFSFAKIFRAVHGSLSPSNISVDGRWLDLSCSSLLSGGKNYQVGHYQIPFFGEKDFVSPLLIEWMETCAKFNEIDVNVKALIQFYKQSYRHFFHQHAAYLLGIPSDIWCRLANQKTGYTVTREIHRVLDWNETIIDCSPDNIDDSDPVIAFIMALYISLSDTRAAHKVVAEKLNNDAGIFEAMLAFQEIFHQLLTAADIKYPSQTAALKHLAIVALKRSWCSAYFYRGRLRKYLASILNTHDIDDFCKVINNSNDIVSWVFVEDDRHLTYLFKFQQLSIGYDAIKNHYFVNADNLMSYFYTYENLLLHISSHYKNMLTINGFDFYEYLEKLQPILSTVEYES
jgi:hypothetical protein